MDFPDPEQIIEVNQRIVSDSGESHSVLNRSNIEQAIFNAEFVIETLQGDISEAAASLLYHLIDHPFEDGNKRTAWVVTRSFLNANGYDYSGSPQEAEQMCVRIAENPSVDKDEVTDWLEPRIQRLN